MWYSRKKFKLFGIIAVLQKADELYEQVHSSQMWLSQGAEELDFHLKGSYLDITDYCCQKKRSSIFLSSHTSLPLSATFSGCEQLNIMSHRNWAQEHEYTSEGGSLGVLLKAFSDGNLRQQLSHREFLSPQLWMPHFQEGHEIGWVSEREQCTSCILSVSKWHMLSSFHFSISVFYKHFQSCCLLWLSWINACICTWPKLIVNYSTHTKMANA